MKRNFIHILVFLVLGLAGVSSCVYPFEAELEGESGTFVIEGDILIGEMMSVKLSYTAPIGNPHEAPAPGRGQVWVEDDKGGVYQGTITNPIFPAGEYNIDMRNADPDLKYRLRVNNQDTGDEYASSWQPVLRAPQIDSLSYILDEKRSQLNVALSMHSQSGSYFKWSYREDWEYTSYYYATLEYIPANRYYYNSTGYGTVQSMFPRNMFYCWNSDVSSEIMLFSTESQTEDRFVDLEFHTIPRDNQRLSILYHIDVELEPISRDAYLYWDNIRNNSEYNGNLFAPNPSEMVGNIRCLNDTTQMAIGFINVAERDTKGMFYDNGIERFYKAEPKYPQDPLEVSDQKQWMTLYNQGYLPYDYKDPAFPSVTLWALKYLVDCTCSGGTKMKPSYWPNTHE